MIDRVEAIRKLAMHVARFSGLAPLAKPFLGGIGVILMLHRTTAALERPDGANRHLNIEPRFLDELLGAMKQDGYRFVTLNEAVERLRDPEAGPPFAVITADDGYRDNLVEALPVFERHGAPFAVYIAPGLTDGSVCLWWEVLDDIVASRDHVVLQTRLGRERLDCSTPAARSAAFARLHDHFTRDVPELDQQAAIIALARACEIDPFRPSRLLMDWDDVARLAAHPLATIGAHTVNHNNLRRLPADAARAEIVYSADILEQRLGFRPRHLAYPYGYAAAVGEREAELARQAGFASAVTTRHGLLHPEHAGHLTALPRISLNGRYQNVAHVRTMLSGVTTPLANAGRRLVTV